MIRYSLIIISSIILLYGCGGNESPKHNDFIGVWRGNDSAEITINADGTIIGKHLPFQLFMRMLHTPQDSTIKLFDGNGTWNYKEGESFGKHQCWTINMEFDNISIEKYKAGMEVNILVRGKNGFWDNKPPWYLFLWVGEEGGDTYNFYKQ